MLPARAKIQWILDNSFVMCLLRTCFPNSIKIDKDCDLLRCIHFQNQQKCSLSWLIRCSSQQMNRLFRIKLIYFCFYFGFPNCVGVCHCIYTFPTFISLHPLEPYVKYRLHEGKKIRSEEQEKNRRRKWITKLIAQTTDVQIEQKFNVLIDSYEITKSQHYQPFVISNV